MQTLRGWWKGSSDSLSQVYMSAHTLTLSESLHFNGHVLKNTQIITQAQTSLGKSWHVITFLWNLGKKWSPTKLWDYWWLHKQTASCSDLPGQHQPQALPWKLHDILRDQLNDIFCPKQRAGQAEGGARKDPCTRANWNEAMGSGPAKTSPEAGEAVSSPSENLNRRLSRHQKTSVCVPILQLAIVVTLEPS